MKFVHLKNRSVIKVEGSDRLTFLQSLLTNDINKANSKEPIYAMLLTPQGRFLYDFYVLAFEEFLLLDCQSTKIEEILKKLTMYKLRQNVTLSKSSEQVFIDVASFNRYISNESPAGEELEFDEYEVERIKRKITDSDKDYIFDRSLPIEFGTFPLTAIDFKKGCYVGQEVVARASYRGVIRKSLYYCTFDHASSLVREKEILAGGKKVGMMLGSHKGFGLALLNIEDFNSAKAANESFVCEGVILKIND